VPDIRSAIAGRIHGRPDSGPPVFYAPDSCRFDSKEFNRLWMELPKAGTVCAGISADLRNTS
jgi:hypothetical protein